jgi:hypothetical protein
MASMTRWLSVTAVLGLAACGVPEQKDQAALAESERSMRERSEQQARATAGEKRAAELSARLGQQEQAVSAASAGATWGRLRREPAERSHSGATSSAVAGAWAGAAALQLACGAHSSPVHLLTFHVGGLLASAAAALLASRSRARA